MDQSRAPLYEALEAMRTARIVPFDVPGHKRGRGNPALTEFLGERVMDRLREDGGRVIPFSWESYRGKA